MAIRKILVFPDSRLRTVSEPVTEFDDELKTLVADMAETMYDAPGIGLAAIQVNVPKRVLVMDLSESKNDLQVFVNPELTVIDDDPREVEEGCLSVPGIYAAVTRPSKVRINAQDIDGKPFEIEADELLSSCANCRQSFDDSQEHFNRDYKMGSLMETVAENLVEENDA